MRQSDRFFERGLKLSHLRLLTLFATVGQVKLVAERLSVSQPAISKQLAEFEAGVGEPLFVRVGNRLQFTAVGEAMLKRAREVILQVEQARYEVDALSSGLSGRLAIGAVATVMPVIAPELVLHMKRRAPNVGVVLIEATSDRLFPMLSSGALDFVFSRTEKPSVAIRDVVSEVMFDDPIVIVCGSEHPLASRRAITPADLAGTQWILPPAEAPVSEALLRWLRRHGLTIPDGCVQSISTSVNAELLQRYPLLGLMPNSMARLAAEAGRLRVLPFGDARFLGRVRLFHKRPASNPVIAAALECVHELRAARGAWSRDSNRS